MKFVNKLNLFNLKTLNEIIKYSNFMKNKF